MVIDGGLASELQNIGHNIDGDPLWSAKLLHTNPDAIKRVHQEYLEAGARIITCASYQASIEGFQKNLNLSVEDSISLMKRSVHIAKAAVDSWMDKHSHKRPKSVWIAGSVGPYGACLHDGSEYSGAYISNVSRERLAEWHRPVLPSTDCLE